LLHSIEVFGHYWKAISPSLCHDMKKGEHLGLELGDVRLLSRVAGARALLDLHEGDFVAARRRLETSIQQYDSMGDHQSPANMMVLAAVLHKQGLDVWSARVLGMADALPGNRPTNSIVAAFQERAGLGDVRAEVRAELGEKPLPASSRRDTS
jgi:hypothetical protein